MERLCKASIFQKTAFESSRVLLIDADLSFQAQISDYMRLLGFTVDTAEDMQTAVKLGGGSHYDVVIVNAKLPDGSGIGLIEAIRTDDNIVKIVIVDSETLTAQKICALESGADDCLSKPVSCRELLLRIRQRMKPTQKHEDLAEKTFHVLMDKMEVYGPDTKKFKLSGNEFQLMMMFVNRRYEVLSRDEISKEIFSVPWNYDDRRVDNLVAKLRKIVEPHGEIPSYIKTVRNKGYVFVGDAEVQDTRGSNLVALPKWATIGRTSSFSNTQG
ncbi:MAG: response regulator transcription factor [Sneathiella sp.]|uniref:response regulator transcription factor n=1 Tax=Sneathiella sp. TaxID=1964365 RepID=UPI003002F741